MLQKNAFIIDEDRDFALNLAAALRNDGLKVSISKGGEHDPVNEIFKERPDIVLVRADGQTKESGFSICSRLKKNRRTQSTPIFIYSGDANVKTFDKHKKQKNRADEYLLFKGSPSMDEFRDRVRGVLFPPGESSKPSKPPPLPPPKEDAKPISEEDAEFMDNLMNSLQREETSDIPSSLPPRREGTSVGRRTTADAKLDMLRKKLRQRESELAKVMEMYRAKEREYHEWNEKLVDKDVEAQSLRVTIEEIKRTSDDVRGELNRRTAEFNASFEQLLEEKITRENELIQVVAGKEKDLGELSIALKDAREKASNTEAELSSKLEALDAAKVEADAKIDTLEGDLKERSGLLEKVMSDLEASEQRETDLRKTCSEQEASIKAGTSGAVSLQETILALRGDLSSTRDEIDHLIRTQNFEIDARDALIGGLKNDLAEAEANFAQTEADLSDDLEALTANLESARADGASVNAAFDAHQEKSAQTELELRSDVERLDRALTEEQGEHRKTQEDLGSKLQEAIERIDSLNIEKEQLSAEAEQQELELNTQLTDRDQQLQTLEQTLTEARQSFEDTESELRAQIESLTGHRAELEKSLAQREIDVDDARTIIGRIEGELTDIRNELSAANDQIASMDAQLAEESERYEELDQRTQDERANLETARLSLEGELAQTRDEAETLEADLREQLIKLGMDIAEKGEQLDVLGRELVDERRERSGAQQRGDDLFGQLEQTKVELIETSTNLRQTEQTLGNARETLALREGRLSELQEAFAKEQEKREESERQLSALRTEHDNRGSLIGRLEGKVAVLEENTKRLQTENTDLEDDLEQTKNTLTDRQSELATARAEANERASRLEELSRQLSHREQDISEIRGQAQALQADKERLTAERAALESKKSALLTEVEGLATKSETLGLELTELKDRADELEAEVDSRGGRIEHLSQNLQAAQASQVELDRTRLSLSSELARAQEALERTQAEFERAREGWASTKSEASAEREGLKNRLAELGSELDNVRDERDVLKSAKALVEEQAAALANLSATEKGNLNREIDALKAAHHGRESELRQEIERRDERVQALEFEQASLRDNLSQERSAKERALDNIDALNKTIGGLKDETEASMAHAESERSGLEERMASLQKIHEQTIQTLDQERGELQSDLVGTRERLQGLEAELAREREQREKETTRLRSEAGALAEKLEEATTRASTLAAEKSSLDEKRKGELAALSQELSQVSQALQQQSAEVEQGRSQLTGLDQQLDDSRRERDELEERYIKELEDVHEEYRGRAKTVDEAHAREVESLRKQAIEAKRQLKESQLAAQRLTDRVQKLETERPTRDKAEQDFESFIAHFQGSGPTTGVRRRPRPSAKPSSRPPVTGGDGALEVPPLAEDEAKALSSPAAQPQEAEEAGEDERTLVAPIDRSQLSKGRPRRGRPASSEGEQKGDFNDWAQNAEEEDLLSALEREFND